MTATTESETETVVLPVHLERVGRVYLSGPMTGYPEFNYPAFRAAAAQLRAVGLDVYNPSETNSPDGGGAVDTTAMTGNEDLDEDQFDIRSAFAGYTRFISLDAEGVAVLPGWEASVGARAEVALAVALKLPVFDAHTLELVDAAGLFTRVNDGRGRDAAGPHS